MGGLSRPAHLQWRHVTHNPIVPVRHAMDNDKVGVKPQDCVVKVFLRKVLWPLRHSHGRYEGSLKIFFRQTFGLQPQVCLQKIFWEPSESSLGITTIRVACGKFNMHPDKSLRKIQHASVVFACQCSFCMLVQFQHFSSALACQCSFSVQSLQSTEGEVGSVLVYQFIHNCKYITTPFSHF